MISAGIVSFYHPGMSHLSPLRILPRPIIKKASHFFPLQVLGGSCQASLPYYRHIKCATARRNHYQEFSSDDGFGQKPFWLIIIQDVAWSLRSLALFLLEQPSQLKYIEWPSIESTAKTATLTLVLVTLLIFSLASVDSFLVYMLALLVRKSA